MDTKQFLTKLKAELLGHGLDHEQVAGYTSRFYKILSAAEPPEAERLIGEFGDPVTLAANIAAKENAGGDVPQKSATPVKPNNAPQQAKKPTQQQNKPVQGTQQNKVTTMSGASEQQKPVAPAPQRKEATRQHEQEPKQPARATAPQRSGVATSVSRQNRQPSKPTEKPQGPRPITFDEVDSYKQPMTKRGKTMFWWTMGLSSPLTIAVAALVALFLGGLYAILAGLVVVSTLTIIVGVLAGLALAIVGFVGGGTGTILEAEANFIGMYEIALALIIIGVVVIASILLYNFIVKIIPILWGLVTRLAKLIFNQFMRLVYFVREECNKRSLEG